MHASITGRSSENICNSSGGAQRNMMKNVMLQVKALKET
jgi:hypothetical protein